MSNPTEARPAWLAWIVGGLLVAACTLAAWTSPGLRDGLGSVLPALPVVLYAAVAIVIVWRPGSGAHLPPWLATPAVLCGSVGAFLTAAFGSWATGRSPLAIGGIVPVTDAGIYLGGAQRYLFDGALDDFNGRRPLNSLFLAVRLAVGGLDLHVALLVQVVLIGAACGIAARAVGRDLGTAAGLAVFAGLFAFGYPAAASSLSEGMGFCLGALAFATLWVAARDRAVLLGAAGVALLTVAQGYRPSTIALPVVLGVWFAVHVRRTGWIDGRALLVCAAGVLLAVSASVAAAAVGGTHLDSLGGNGGYSMYGLARGSPTWTASGQSSWGVVYTDHPEEMRARTERQRTRFVNNLAREEITSHPATFLRTYLRSSLNYAQLVWREATAPLGAGAGRIGFGAIAMAAVVAGMARRRRAPPRTLLTDAALLAASAVAVPAITQTWAADQVFAGCGMVLVGVAIVAFGVIGTSRLRSVPQLQFTLLAFAVMVLELPVLGVDNTRIFLSLAGFVTVPLAMAVALLQGRLHPADQARRAPRTGGPRWAPAIVGAGVVAATLVGAPAAAALVDEPRTPPSRTCPDGAPSTPLIVGAIVRFGPEPSDIGNVDTDVPPRPASPLFADVARYFFDQVKVTVGAPLTVVAGLTSGGNDRLVFLQGAAQAEEGDVLQTCTTPVRGFFGETLRVFYAQPITFEIQQGTALER